MLVSHRHRFVFIKPRKTAGTSVELALSPVLEAGDLATPIQPEEEPLREAAPRVQVGRIAYRHLGLPRHLRDHSPLSQLYRALPETREYRVVTMCRNPWDRAVSQFFWSLRRTDVRSEPFETQKAEFIAYTHKWGPRTWLDPLYGRKRQRALDSSHLYHVGGVFRPGFVIRFEHLEADFAALGDWLGLRFAKSPADFGAKGGLRPKSSGWTRYFDDGTRELVARCCAREIALYGYDFEGTAPQNGPVFG